MTAQVWTYLLVTLTFFMYLYIGWRSRVRESSGFYVAGQGAPVIAAIFVSMTYVAGQRRGV